MKYPNHRNSRAFTLIELLVVVAIIAILMTILIPSLGAAKKNAQTSVCLSNLKQLGIGTAMYQQENNYQFLFPTTSITESTGWFTGIDGYLGSLARDNIGGKGVVGKRNYRKFKQCPIWAGLSTAPASPTASAGAQTIQQWSRTIKMNTHLRRPGSKQARLGDIESPADHVVYGDGSAPDNIPWGPNPKADANEAGSMSMDTTDNTQGGPALRHAGGANMVFVDGHASTIRLKTIKREVTSALKVDGWASEWLSGGTPVSGSGKLASPTSNAYTRNPDMPLVWAIPGRIYR